MEALYLNDELRDFLSLVEIDVVCFFTEQVGIPVSDEYPISEVQACWRTKLRSARVREIRRETHRHTQKRHQRQSRVPDGLSILAEILVRTNQAIQGREGGHRLLIDCLPRPLQPMDWRRIETCGDVHQARVITQHATFLRTSRR